MATSGGSEPHQIRRGTRAAAISQNILLLDGQLFWEKDTRQMKVGDGNTLYSSLAYVNTGGGGGASSFAALPDAASADLPGINTVLAGALSGKVSTARKVNNKALSVEIVLDKADIGIPLVDNTADLNKPVSGPQQTAINSAISQLIGGSPPGVLDQINEIANALGGDANFSASILASLANKLSNAAGAVTSVNLAPIATKTYLGRSSSGTGQVEGVPLATLKSDLGIGDVQIVSFATAIPLDSVTGKRTTTIKAVDTDLTLTLGASPVTDGYYECVFSRNGTNTLTIPANWSAGGDTITNVDGDRFFIAFNYLAVGEVIYQVRKLSSADITAPTFGTPAIADGLRTRIVLPMNETIGATVPATGDITLASAGGRTVTAVAAVGVNLNIDVSSAFDWQSAPTVAVASNKVSDTSGNLAGASGTLSVTNNIVMPVPGAPTALANGTMTNTTAPLSVTAPTVDGTHGSVTDYVWEWAIAGSGSWNVFADGTSTTPSTTITGLSAGTSYDFRAKAINGTGAGSYTSTLTVATTGSKITFNYTYTAADGTPAPTPPAVYPAGAFDIADNGLRHTNANGTYESIFYPITPSPVDYDISFDISAVGGTAYPYLYLRSHTSGDDYIAILRNDSDSSKLSIINVVNGVTVDSVTEASPSTGWFSGINLKGTMRTVAGVTTVKAYIDNVEIISLTLTDESNMTLGYCGYGMNTSHTAERVDNFIAA